MSSSGDIRFEDLNIVDDVKQWLTTFAKEISLEATETAELVGLFKRTSGAAFRKLTQSDVAARVATKSPPLDLEVTQLLWQKINDAIIATAGNGEIKEVKSVIVPTVVAEPVVEVKKAAVPFSIIPSLGLPLPARFPSALELGAMSDAKFAEYIEPQSLETNLRVLSTANRRTLISSIYDRVIRQPHVSITKRLADEVAYQHGLANLSKCILQSLEDADDLKVKSEATELVVYIDHSGSMDQPRVMEMAESLVKTLQKRVAEGSIVHIYPFGDKTHERKTAMTVAQYSGYCTRATFNGGCTEINPAWDLSARESKSSCVAVIVSDGEFNGRFKLENLQMHHGIRAVIFYAPPWSPADVTKKHAAVISSHISENAVYNGDILPGRIDMLGTVLDSLVGSSIVPELPGRTRIGTISLPSRLLLPSGMAQVLRAIVAVNNDDDCQAAITFLTKLTVIYDQLLATARECIERCFFGQLFAEMMSLNPAIIKFCEAAIGGVAPMQQIEGDGADGEDDDEAKEKKDVAAITSKYMPRLSPYLSNLHRTVDTLRTYCAGEKQRLITKYTRDAAKTALIESVFARAVTVSERVHIMEKRGTPAAYLNIPALRGGMAELGLLVNLFNVRIRVMNASPESPEVDQLLVSLLQRATLSTSKPAGVMDEHTIPVYKLKNGHYDVLTMIRLLPAYLRHQQYQLGQQQSADMTFQPRTALRVAYVLRAAQIQGCPFPTYIAEALPRLVAPHGKFDVSVSAESDTDNLTGYWMRILLTIAQWHLTNSDGETSATNGISADEEKRIGTSLSGMILSLQKRLRATALKFYIIRDIINDIKVPYRVPTYPGTVPFMNDCKDSTAYIVWRDEETNQYIDPVTKAPMGSAPREIIGDKAIASAFDMNYLYKGGYIRPTYLTGGKVFLYSDGGSATAQQVMALQLQQLSWSPAQVQAHLHTLLNADAFRSVAVGTDPSVTIAQVKARCMDAPVLWEDLQATVTRQHIITALCRSYLSDKDGNGNDGGVSGVSASQFIARVLHASFYVLASDHAAYNSDIDYLLVAASRSLSAIPDATEPGNGGEHKEDKTNGASTAVASSRPVVVPLLPEYHASVMEAVKLLFAGYRTRCDEALARCTDAPILYNTRSEGQ